MIKNYNINNILTYSISLEKDDMFKGLNEPFSYFENEANAVDPDIILNIGKFNPSNSDCYMVDHHYHVKENYFYCADNLGRIKFEVEMFGFETGQTIINFHGKFGGPEYFLKHLITQEIILFPIMVYKLGIKGFLLSHAGSVSKSGGAHVFAGRGGSHKTSLMTDFVRSGFGYLGDDWIILDKNEVIPFPKNINEFNFGLKNNLPTENTSSLMDKLRYFFNMSKSPPKGHIPITIAEKQKIKNIFLLYKHDGDAININKMSCVDGVKKIIANNQVDLFISPSVFGKTLGRYMSYMLAYAFIFPQSKLFSFWEDLEKRYLQHLQDVPFYSVMVPRKYTKEVYEKLSDAINTV